MLNDALESHLKDVFAVFQGDLRDGQEEHVARDGCVHLGNDRNRKSFQKFYSFVYTG